MKVTFTLTNAANEHSRPLDFMELDHDEMEDVILQLAEFEDRFGGIVLTQPYDQVCGVTMHIEQ